MSPQNTDHTRTFFLDHDGLTYFYRTGHWLKIECQEVPETPERPAGLKYSIALFGPDNECLVHYDNSHAIKVTGRSIPRLTIIGTSLAKRKSWYRMSLLIADNF